MENGYVQTNGAAPQKKGRKRGAIIAIIVTAAALLAAIAVLVMLLLGEKKELAAADDEIDALEDELDLLEEQYELLEETNETLTADSEALSADLAALQQTYDELMNERDSLAQGSGSLSDELAALEDQLAASEAAVSEERLAVRAILDLTYVVEMNMLLQMSFETAYSSLCTALLLPDADIAPSLVQITEERLDAAAAYFMYMDELYPEELDSGLLLDAEEKIGELRAALERLLALFGEYQATGDAAHIEQAINNIYNQAEPLLSQLRSDLAALDAFLVEYLDERMMELPYL